jgi:DNA-binding MarR family transcriptional regulator
VKSSKALPDSDSIPDPLGLAEQMIHVLPACHRLILAAVHRTPHTRGMSLTQFRILKRLNEREHRATELASSLEIGKSTLTISVDSLVRRGFVERSDLVGDRRASVLRITPAGEVLVRALEHSAAGGLASVLTQLTSDERKALSQGFDGLERALREPPNTVKDAELTPVGEGEY